MAARSLPPTAPYTELRRFQQPRLLAVAIGHSPPSFPEPLVHLHVSQHHYRVGASRNHPQSRPLSHRTSHLSRPSTSSLATSAYPPRATGPTARRSRSSPTSCFPPSSPHTLTNEELGAADCLHTPPSSNGPELNGGGPRAEVTRLGAGGLNPLVICGRLLPQRSHRARVGSLELRSRKPPSHGGGIAWAGKSVQSALGTLERWDIRCLSGWARGGRWWPGLGGGRGPSEWVQRADGWFGQGRLSFARS